MKNMKLSCFLLVILFVSGIVGSCKKQVAVTKPLPPAQEQKENGLTNPPPAPPAKPVVAPADFVPNYEIVKQTDQIRKDKGLTFYIIVRPVDLSSDVFIIPIKNLVKQMVKEKIKSEKITIEIFDSLNALDLYVKDSSSNAPLLTTHHIASYVGDSSDEIYLNTLYLFPNSTKEDKSAAGKFFDVIDFDPANW
jgi:hypothetical protein